MKRFQRRRDRRNDTAYRRLQCLGGILAPSYVIGGPPRVWMEDQAFMEGLDVFRPYGLRDSLERYFNLQSLARSAAIHEGEYAECGAFYGGSTYVLLRVLSGTSRRLHVFESFEGLPAPGGRDGGRWREGDFRSSQDVFLRLTENYSLNRCLHVGDVRGSLRELTDERFSFVHIDLDLYDATKYATTFFLARLVPGGIIVCDDYGFPAEVGSRRAVDEACQAVGAQVVPLSSGQAVIFRCV